jgi:hypothetical protein
MKTSTSKSSLLALALGLVLGAASLFADEAPAIGVRKVLTDGPSLVGQPVVLEGFVTGVCHSGGKKAFLHDLDPDAKGNLRVERTGDMPVFDQELNGQTLRVSGVVRELRIDAAYLDSWEARVKAAHAEKDEKKECDGHDCDSSLSNDAAIKRINALRAQLAKSSKGYLSSIWVDGTTWEVKPEGK